MSRWCTGLLLTLPLVLLSGVAAVTSADLTTRGQDFPADQGVRSPLRPTGLAVDGLPTVMPLVLDAEALAVVRQRDRVTLRDFALAPTEPGAVPTTVEMTLERIDPFTDDAQIVLGSLGDEPDRALPRPDVDLFRGLIAGEPDARAFLSFSPHGVYGFVNRGDRMQIISSGPSTEALEIAMYDRAALPEGAIHWRDFVCETADPDAPFAVPAREGAGAGDGDLPCRSILLAIETDTEFTSSLFGGNVNASAAYIATMVSAASEIYTADLAVQFQAGFVRLWEGPDPWDGNNTSTQLAQFRSYWNSNMGHVDRHLAHMLSGRSLGGGIAYLQAVCHPTNGYAVSASLNGFFPYPLQNNSGQNWDIIVFTHELGHNVGTPHTHNFCPPLDECAPQNYWGSCQDDTTCINNGTIMSYCHLCPGGTNNIRLEFHPAVQATILDFLESVNECPLGCAVFAVPDEYTSIQAAIDDALGGDTILVGPGTYFESLDFGGKPVNLQSTDGPENTIIDATGSDDSAIRIVNAGSIGAVVEGFTIRGGVGTPSGDGRYGGGIYSLNSGLEVVNCIVEGNTADRGAGIFNLGDPLRVRDSLFIDNAAGTFGGAIYNYGANLSSYEDSTFIGNTSTYAGAIFNVISTANVTGCAFELNIASNAAGAISADASSQLLIADSAFCGNAPSHLSGAWNDGGGNVFDNFCPGQVPGDLDGNDLVDVFDLLVLLGQWGPCANPDDCPADLNDDNEVNVFDMLILLGNWG